MDRRTYQKHWILADGEWQLFAPMHSWDEVEKVLARIKNTVGSSTEYVGTICDFRQEEEAPEIDIYNAAIWEDFPTLEEAKEHVDYLLQCQVTDMMADADDIFELFND